MATSLGVGLFCGGVAALARYLGYANLRRKVERSPLTPERRRELEEVRDTKKRVFNRAAVNARLLFEDHDPQARRLMRLALVIALVGIPLGIVSFMLG